MTSGARVTEEDLKKSHVQADPRDISVAFSIQTDFPPCVVLSTFEPVFTCIYFIFHLLKF